MASGNSDGMMTNDQPEPPIATRAAKKKETLTLVHLVNTVAGARLFSIWISGSAEGSASGAEKAVERSVKRVVASVKDFIVVKLRGLVERWYA